MVRNELRQCLADKLLEGDFSAAAMGPSDGHKRPLSQIVDVAVKALDRRLLPLVVAQKMESLGQEQVDGDGFCQWNGLSRARFRGRELGMPNSTRFPTVIGSGACLLCHRMSAPREQESPQTEWAVCLPSTPRPMGM